MKKKLEKLKKRVKFSKTNLRAYMLKAKITTTIAIQKGIEKELELIRKEKNESYKPIDLCTNTNSSTLIHKHIALIIYVITVYSILYYTCIYTQRSKFYYF
jgi:hypothetical protein